MTLSILIKELDKKVEGKVSYETYTSNVKELEDLYPNLDFKITYSGVDLIRLSEDYIKKVLTAGEYEVYKSRLLQIDNSGSDYYEGYDPYSYFKINIYYGIDGTNKVSELDNNAVNDLVDNLGLYPSLATRLTKDITKVYNKLKSKLEELVTEDVLDKISKLYDYTSPKLGSKEYYDILIDSLNIEESDLTRGILSIYLKESLNEELTKDSNQSSIYYFMMYDSKYYPGSISVGHDDRDYGLRVRYILGEDKVVVEKHVRTRRIYENSYNIKQGIEENNVNLEDKFLKELGIQEIFNDKLSNINEVLQLVDKIKV